MADLAADTNHLLSSACPSWAQDFAMMFRVGQVCRSGDRAVVGEERSSTRTRVLVCPIRSASLSDGTVVLVECEQQHPMDLRRLECKRCQSAVPTTARPPAHRCPRLGKAHAFRLGLSVHHGGYLANSRHGPVSYYCVSRGAVYAEGPDTALPQHVKGCILLPLVCIPSSRRKTTDVMTGGAAP